MKYKYAGYNRQAQKIEGTIEASSQSEVLEKLKSQQIRPTHLILIQGGGGGKTGESDSLLDSLGLLGNKKPNLSQMSSFVRQLATMQGAGIPIVQSLAVLADQVENRHFGRVLSQVQTRIEEGMSLTEALKKHSQIFDKIFVNLVAAGEVSGSLEKVLNRLAIYYEKMASLKRKIISAATYPTVIMVMVVGIVLGLLFFLVPTFATIFQQNGSKLPAMTQGLLDLSNLLRKYWYLVVGGIGGIVGGVYFLFTNEQFQKTLDPILLRLPLIGELFQKTATARFSRTLATMLQSGVPLLEALDITAHVSGNYHIAKAILNAKQSISEGSSIAEPLERQKVFPKMVTSMMAVGEQTGSMDQMLTKISDFYEDEVEHKVAGLTSLLEPFMIVFVGGAVLAILIPLYLPLMKMSEVVSGSQ